MNFVNTGLLFLYKVMIAEAILQLLPQHQDCFASAGGRELLKKADADGLVLLLIIYEQLEDVMRDQLYAFVIYLLDFSSKVNFKCFILFLYLHLFSFYWNLVLRTLAVKGFQIEMFYL